MASSDESADDVRITHFSVPSHNTTTTDDNTSTSCPSDYEEFENVPETAGLGYSMQMDHNLDQTIYQSNKRDLGGNDHQPAKKIKSEWVERYSDKAVSIMNKMGYDKDKGLGKSGQGRLEPIEPLKHEGRRGFGLKLEGLSEAAVQWKSQSEEIKIPEQIQWLLNNDFEFLDNITRDDLDIWINRLPKKLTIDDEVRFCDPEILANVLSSKSVFDDLNANDMRRARTRSNPFETIRGSIFLNRAAVKMANIDSLCDFMFTNPVDDKGQPLIKSNDLLYFADMCAGPGGFSEYVLYRKGWEAKGFGFTLKGENDFKLDEFHAGSPETFDPYYGVKEDGNIFDPENQESFAAHVLKQTDNMGVHFVMADGGFSVEGKENIQEILSKQLYLCQCLVALSILREKGHFVCKFFDIFTPFSVGLIYLMYKCFQEISICKPNTSRPANSERYLICKWKKPNTDTIQKYMFCVNQDLLDNGGEDVYEIVSHANMEQDQQFYNYILESNNEIGRNQIIGLIKIAAYCNDKNLKETQQAEYRKKCLNIWKIPDHMRKKLDLGSTESLLSELLQEWYADKQMLNHSPFELQSWEHLEKQISKSVYDWHFVPVCREETERNQKTFFLCKGGRHVLRLTGGSKWEPVDFGFEISPKTLLYGEIVTELIGEGKSQNRVNALHIIDGIVLGGVRINRLPLKERFRMCDKFAKALNKPHKNTMNSDGVQKSAPIRCKKLFSLFQIQIFFNEMRKYNLKDGAPRLGFRIRDENAERFFVPGGLMFFNELNPPFVCALSKSSNKLYYHNAQNNDSFFIDSLPKDVRLACYSSFRSSFHRRLLWKWTNVYQVEQDVAESEKDSNILFRDDFNRYIVKILSR